MSAIRLAIISTLTVSPGKVIYLSVQSLSETVSKGLEQGDELPKEVCFPAVLPPCGKRLPMFLEDGQGIRHAMLKVTDMT